MKKVFVLILLIGSVCFTSAQDKLKVSINKNMELLGLVYTIIYENIESDLFDTTDERWEYGKMIVKEYGHHIANKELRLLLPKIDHLWISNFTYLLTVIEDFPNAKIPENFDFNSLLAFSKNHNLKEAEENIRHFIDFMNMFYKEIAFDNYFKEKAIYYENAVKETEKNIRSTDFITPLEAIYDVQYKQYILVPVLTLPPGMGFATYHENNSAYNIFSAVTNQNLRANIVGFDHPDYVREQCVHEFGHSLIESSFQKIPIEVFKKTSSLFKPLKNSMRRQNYLNWVGTVNEHFVRSVEIMIAKKLKLTESEQRLSKEYIEDKDFIHIPKIIKSLTNSYNKNENRAKMFEKALSSLIQIKKKKQQKKEISGVIKTAKTGEPIPYIHIGVLNKNFGVISREDGTFNIDISKATPNDLLHFSSIGFKEYAIPITDIKNSYLEVTLKEDITLLDEVLVEDKEIFRTQRFGRTKATKTVTGESNTGEYGRGGEHGILITPKKQRFLLQDVNFHMRYNTTDSILFRINIYNVANRLPDKSILKKPLYMKSYNRQKWIRKNFNDQKIIITDDVIVTYEIVKIWYSKRTDNAIFFTWGKGYDEGKNYVRESSFDSWKQEEAIPITLYVTGRLF